MVTLKQILNDRLNPDYTLKDYPEVRLYFSPYEFVPNNCAIVIPTRGSNPPTRNLDTFPKLRYDPSSKRARVEGGRELPAIVCLLRMCFGPHATVPYEVIFSLRETAVGLAHNINKANRKSKVG